MEELESAIGFQNIRIYFKGVVVNAWIPVSNLVILFDYQETDDPFYLSQAVLYLHILKLPLIAELKLTPHVVEVFDDVEGINADSGIREVLFGDRPKWID